MSWNITDALASSLPPGPQGPQGPQGPSGPNANAAYDQANAAYTSANSAANTVRVSSNGGSTLSGKQLNFINTSISLNFSKQITQLS